MSGFPVVIVEKGGFPVKAVETRAPIMMVAENGMGVPIVLSERGAPFIIEGLPEPEPEPEGD